MNLDFDALRKNIEQSSLFDGKWYLLTNPDVASAGMDPLVHYINYGAKEGRDPSQWFDARWYVNTYPEATTDPNPLLHYIRAGAAQGLVTHPGLPIERSCLFDRKWYLLTNPDVVSAGMDPLVHYMDYGAKEGRNPNRWFEARWYVDTYPEAANDPNPLLHYIREGAARGLATHPGFPFDLWPGKRTGGYAGEVTPLGAFVRAWGNIEASFMFERDWYLDRYQDVAASGGDAFEHYMFHGVAEGRNPNRLFDTRWYLSMYPEVAASGENPLAHYIREGWTLGYDPHPFFSTRGHQAQAGEQAIPGVTPLEDFLHRAMRRDPSLFPIFTRYDVHRATEDIRRRRQYPAFSQHIATMTCTPKFVVLIDGNGDGTNATLNSLANQIYARYRIVRTQAELCEAARFSEKELTYGLWLKSGDELDPDTLYFLAAELNTDSSQDLIYFDHDEVTENGLRMPLHKPDWSPDHFEASNYIGSAFCFRLRAAEAALSAAQSCYDFLLRFTETHRNIRLLDCVLMHRPEYIRSLDREDENVRAIAARLERTGRRGTVNPNGTGALSYDIAIELRETPLVSIVIPTAARIIQYEGRSIDLIVDCVTAIVETSTYPSFEFVIVDNGDFDRNRLAHIAQAHIRYVTYTLPEVNIAKKINLGVAHAKGSVILVLNDDVIPVASDWIERMLAHLEKPHVGMVGAKLIYPNGLLQHVGMVTCDGHPHHCRHTWPRDDRGYADSTIAVRNYVAVTGAVSMTTRDIFIEAGGYPEELPIDYNDVFLCYKLREKNLTIVYEPRAELIHYHAVSAIRSPRPQDFEYFSRRWSGVVRDPYYNEYCLRKPLATFELDYTERKH